MIGLPAPSAMASPFDPLHSGSVPLDGGVGKYVDLVQIGEGAMGRVFRARDSVLDRTVAIKTILPGSSVFGEDGLVRRFRREARIAAGLNHPGIVTIHDFGEESGLFYLVMEYLEGEDLGQAMRRNSIPDRVDRLRLLADVCEAVAFAHGRGMIHRDLKPSNVFRTREGRVKVLDFGLALGAEAPRTTMGLAGTPQYMSPEQVKGAELDARSDVFSLGAMLYELLTDERCFPAPTIHAILFQVLQRQPTSVRERDPNLPELADLVVAKALAKDPEYRFPDAQQLLDAVLRLRRVLLGEADGDVEIAALDLEAFRASEAPTGGIALANLPPIPPRVAGLGSSVATTDSEARPPEDAPRAEVRFAGETGGDRVMEVAIGTRVTLLDLALGGGIPIFHECGGRARCSTCRVRVLAGSGLLPRTSKEENLATRLGWGEDIRLSCQATVAGDVRVKRLVEDVADFGLLRKERRTPAPRETTLAVLCVRVRNADQVLDRSAPYDVVHLLNRFYFEAGEPVLAAGGEIAECRDAGLVAYFGLEEGSAAEKCLAAVRAGLRIARRSEALREELGRTFAFEPDVGVGIHFARTLVGHVGHPSVQRWTALGRVHPVARWVAGIDVGRRARVLATEDVVNLVEHRVRLGETVADPATGGSDRDAWEILDLREPDGVLMIQSSFDLVQPRRREAAALFYRLLFQLDPGAEALFRDVDMAEQGDKLMDVLATAVQGLGRFEELRPVLHELGRRHVGYGVRLEHFDAVEQALLETMSRMLGPAFTPELRGQWARTLGALSAEMIEAGFRPGA